MRFIITSILAAFIGAEGILLNAGGAKHKDVKDHKFRQVSLPFLETVDAVPNISDLPANLTTGSLLAYEPTSPNNADLFVFFAGSMTPCELYSDFLETIAEDMQTLCLPYDNRDYIMRLCKGKALDCFEKVRGEAYDGDFQGVEDNNQHDRLASALKHLSKIYVLGYSSWAKYLDADGSPKWSSMRVGGHSQGAGSAAWIAYKEKVNRVVQVSGPCEPVSWTANMSSKTPPDQFYGLGHQFDFICLNQFKNWEAEGITGMVPTTNATIPAQSALVSMHAQSVVSTIQPVSCGPKGKCENAPHGSVLTNGFWQVPNPYVDIWKFLVGV